MASIRKTTTASGATAVQVVEYDHRKVVILKHIGSARTLDEVAALIESAEAWIAQHTPMVSLFAPPPRRTLPLATARYEGVLHTLVYDALMETARRMGFATLPPLLLDLAIMRIIEPASKLRTIALLERYVGVRYSERSVYRILPKLHDHKADAERIATLWAREGLSSDLALVLYDVTTLYFETFKADELRVPGFSKDNKAQQPQIVVGLLVTREGFPLGYEVFKGNTFEGKTMLPVLEAFIAQHGVTTPIVVADAAMISRTNVADLTKHGLSYIVGARLANASPAVIAQASAALAQTDGATIRISTDHGDLIVSFSSKRYRKDKHEMEQQKAKAVTLVERGEPGKRAKFVTKTDGTDAYVLNEALIEKTKLLLGLKGYYTNIPVETLSDLAIVARYHDLWHVEASFRMAKSDLATRPIFHHKEDAVRAHMVVCFVALAIGRNCEISTGLSLRRVVDALWQVTDAQIVDTATGEVFMLRSALDETTRTILKKLGVSY